MYMDAEEKTLPQAKSMERSKGQIAISYSPGTFFNLEGELIVCITKSKEKYDSLRDINDYTEKLIFQKIEEKVKNWYRIGTSCRANVLPIMSVEESLLDYENIKLKTPFPRERFGLVEAETVAYEPSLLTFYCNKCKIVKYFQNIRELNKRIYELRKDNNADVGGGNCEHSWKQMDIVFIHPNGGYMNPVPWKWNWSPSKNKLIKSGISCYCGEVEVRIHGDKSTQIGKRYFYCANPKCGKQRGEQWLQNDKEYLELTHNDDSFSFATQRMKPVSCRSNSTHYTMQDMVIDFEQSDLLEILVDDSGQQLSRHICERFKLSTDLDSEDVFEDQVKLKLGDVAWNKYLSVVKSLVVLEGANIEEQDEQLLSFTRDRKNKIISDWVKQGVVNLDDNLAKKIKDDLITRNEDFSSKYDPYRLLIEHDNLRKHIVNDSILDNGLRRFVPLDNLDEYVGPDDEEKKQKLNSEHRVIMDSIGISTIGLVRDFKLVNFSYGYSRVSSSPSVDYINNQTIPVKLKLFDSTKIGDSHSKHPIFILKQDNEAIYVQLDESSVRAWLNSIEVNEGLTEEPIGYQYLKHVPPMDAFLDSLPTIELDGPQLSLAIYTLLHSYSHHLMHAISEFSGLNIGSMGEYIFPSDLAFVVYRRGNTVDLGNLTAMLRNNAPAFLNYLKNLRSLSCGSSSLCEARGGACPDCILIPEISCIAQNKLLSRSVLNGKHHPGLYGFKNNIPGFLVTSS